MLVLVAAAFVARGGERTAHAGTIPLASDELDAVAIDALRRPAAPELVVGRSASLARRPARPSRDKKRKSPTKTAPPRWVRPTKGPLTSTFGWRWGRMHRGLDFAGAYGSPIYAATDGVITFAGPKGGYGNLIVITHSNGLQTAYGHMSQFVRTSGRVRAGQQIGRIGSTGYSTGPHLHFEVRLGEGDDAEGQVNPAAFLRERGVKI